MTTYRLDTADPIWPAGVPVPSGWAALGYRAIGAMFYSATYHPATVYAVLQDSGWYDGGSPCAIARFDAGTGTRLLAKLIDYNGDGITTWFSDQAGPIVRPPISNYIYTARCEYNPPDGTGFWFVKLDATTLDFVAKSDTPADVGYTNNLLSTDSNAASAAYGICANQTGSLVLCQNQLAGFGHPQNTAVWGIWDTANDVAKWFNSYDGAFSGLWGVSLEDTPHAFCFDDAGHLWTLNAWSVGYGTDLNLDEFSVTVGGGDIVLTHLNRYTLATDAALDGGLGASRVLANKLAFSPTRNELVAFFGGNGFPSSHNNTYLRIPLSSPGSVDFTDRVVIQSTLTGDFGNWQQNANIPYTGWGDWTDETEFVFSYDSSYPNKKFNLVDIAAATETIYDVGDTWADTNVNWFQGLVLTHVNAGETGIWTNREDDYSENGGESPTPIIPIEGLGIYWIIEAAISCCEDPVIVDADVVALLSQRALRVAHLVQFDFLSAPKYLWNGFHNITTGGHTWQGLRRLGAIEGLEESADLASSQMKFTVSGVDANILALAIGEDRGEYVGRIVTVWLQFFDADWQLVGDPIARASGIMDGIEVNRARGEDGGSVRTLTLTAENIFYGRGVPPAGNYTDRDQQFRSPGDLGLTFISEVQNTVIQVPW